jgi:ABC-type multidrug transport system ATPase subunit
MAQDPNIYADLTVAENLRYFASLYRASPAPMPRIRYVTSASNTTPPGW